MFVCFSWKRSAVNSRIASLVISKMEMKMVMPSYFEFGNDVTMLFRKWKVSTDAGMFGTCVALFLFCVIYESFKALRLKLQVNGTVLFTKYKTSKHDNKVYSLLVPSSRRKFILQLHILQTFMQMLQLLIAYFVMLAVMTYNAWLCLAAVLGYGVGYFFFDWRSNESLKPDNEDRCV